VVLDAQGNTIAGATVTLTSKETNKATQSTSDSAGVYNFLSLPPGRYRIEAEMTGFKKKVMENVIVEAEQTQGVNITLEVGDVASRFWSPLTLLPPSIHKLATSAGPLTPRKFRICLRLNRDPFQLLRLAPGVFGDAAHGASGDSQKYSGQPGLADLKPAGHLRD